MPRKQGELVKGASTVRGLRFESDVYPVIEEYARQMAAEHGTEINMAAAVRSLVRRALSVSRRHDCEKEAYYVALAEARRKLADAVTG
jgi:hypothetical protein